MGEHFSTEYQQAIKAEKHRKGGGRLTKFPLKIVIIVHPLPAYKL